MSSTVPLITIPVPLGTARAHSIEGAFLEIKQNHIETLVGLGLTQSQAKIFLAISQHEITSPKKISEITKIATPHVYVIIESLEKIVLIEKSLEKPTTVKAVKTSEAIKFLIERKQQQILSVTQEAQDLIKELEENNSDNQITSPKTQFVWISKKDPYLRKRHHEILNSKKSIKFIVTWERFPKIIYNFSDSAVKSLERGVKIQVILEKPENTQSVKSITRDLRKFPNYEIRYCKETPHAIVAIFDNFRAIIDISSTGDLEDEHALWTENPCLTSVFLDYFDVLWANSVTMLPD